MASRFRLWGTPQDPIATLEIRGLSRGSAFEKKNAVLNFAHPYLDSNEDDNSTIKNDFRVQYSPKFPLEDDDFTVSESWSGANSSTTGNTTERSSIYSWGDDVLDHKASNDVQEMFYAIERMLFEGVLSGSSLLQKECREWMDTFPHFRVKGKQALHVKDEGYQFYDGTVLSSRKDVHVSDGPDTEPLISLSGSSMTLLLPPVSCNACQATTSQQVMPVDHLKEEIFEQDGNIEEYLAFDIREIDEEYTVKHYYVPRRRRLGYPPITPNACVRDAVINYLFDNTWVKIISYIKRVKVYEETPRKMTKSFWKGLFDSYGSAFKGSNNNNRCEERLRFDSDDRSDSRYFGNCFEHRNHGVLISQSDHFPYSRELGDATQRHGRSYGRYQFPKSDFTSLHSVMMIRRKELSIRSDRISSCIPSADNAMLANEKPSVFPRTSGSRLHLPGALSPQIQNQFLPLSLNRQTSAKHRNRGKPFQTPKLHPLIDRARTPSAVINRDWTVKGRNMPLSSFGLSHLEDHSEVIGIRVSSPTTISSVGDPCSNYYGTRVLPPLHLQSLNENMSAEFARRPQRADRISSAMPEDTSKPNSGSFEGILRPNTTHTFRNDNNLIKRSSSVTPNISSRHLSIRANQHSKAVSPTGLGPIPNGNLYSHNLNHSPDGNANFHGLAGIHGIAMMGHSGSNHSPHDDDSKQSFWGNPSRRRQVMGS